MFTAQITASVLTKYHYKSLPLDDAMSEKTFDRYLKGLDGGKLYFTQSDVDDFATYRTRLDDAILQRDLSAPFAIFNRYQQRAFKRYTFARKLLKGGFDFSQKESYQYRRDKAPWESSEAELNEVWRKLVKASWLQLKIAGKDDKAIADILDKRYANSLKRLAQTTSNDAFQGFLNAYTMAVEPHTSYFGPRAAEDFDIAMRLSLTGIGATLKENNNFITIHELVPGGPAALSGQLHAGDRILGVAQGASSAMTDIIGWRVDDAVTLIRGPADSTVVLDILPANAGPAGKHLQVAMVRKKITLEEQAAQKSIQEVTDGDVKRRIGVIRLPSFYDDSASRRTGKAEFKSTSRDVARLLGELKAEKVDAVLMDLRNNGGGSLPEAVALTGLFVGKGPVLQVRNAEGAIEVLNNTENDQVWDGPVGVLVNRGSASASEIFAAAIQDYGRGLVIGEPSFGKGTVQTVSSLDEMARIKAGKLGQLHFTIAQFFRINGGTTQLRGVTPDLSFPTLQNVQDFGEASYDNALPWMQIPQASYVPSDALTPVKSQLQVRSEARINADKGFQCRMQGFADYEQQYQKNLLTLNEAERRHEQATQEARAAACDLRKDALQKASAGKRKPLRDDGLMDNERDTATQLAEEKALKEAKDILLDEAAHILSDEVGLAKRPSTLAAQRPTGAAVGAVQ